MALQVQVYKTAPPRNAAMASHQPTWGPAKNSVAVNFACDLAKPNKGGCRPWPRLRVRCSLETGAAAATAASKTAAAVGQVTEVDKDTFWPIVNDAGDKTVVLDMYTQWCGPCKVMAPKFQELSREYLDVIFLKLDCNQDNKPLAKELGIHVVPTFKILKGGKIVEEVRGAKFDNLVSAIENARSST